MKYLYNILFILFFRNAYGSDQLKETRLSVVFGDENADNAGNNDPDLKSKYAELKKYADGMYIYSFNSNLSNFRVIASVFLVKKYKKVL